MENFTGCFCRNYEGNESMSENMHVTRLAHAPVKPGHDTGLTEMMELTGTAK